MIVNKAILHVLDFNSNICVFSQTELDLSDMYVCDFLNKHINRINKDADCKRGVLGENSILASKLNEYLMTEISFIDFTYAITEEIFMCISRSDKLVPMDVLVIDFSEDSLQYVSVLLLAYKTAYTHFITNETEHVNNKIIQNSAILPSPTQKVDNYAVVNCNDKSVSFADNVKRLIDGEDVFIMPDKLLQCVSSPSSNEAVKTVYNLINKVAEEYEANPVLAVSKAKTYLRDNAELASSFSPSELAQEVFDNSEPMQESFERHIEEYNLPSEVHVNKATAIRIGKSHKIKTDTGIEVTFPAEYFNNRDFIEFINNPDGTISIELKNIGKIINR